MWIGLLTAGAHPSRAAGDNEAVTLLAWGRKERLRIDGPPAAVVGGLRSVRRHAPAALGVAHDPRCFACREPYPLPFADVIRARADAGDLGADDDADPVVGAWNEREPDTVVQRRDTDGRNAVFLLVHVDDDAPAGDEGEALVVVAGTNTALLVPFDAMARMVDGISAACAEDPVPRCCRCGCPVPGGAIGAHAPAAGPNRAQRRREARRVAGRRRAA
jgi:hypothetical protein